MYIIQPGDVLEARMWCTAGDQASVTTFWFQPAAGMVVGPTDRDFAQLLDTSLSSLIKATLSDDSVYNGFQVATPLVRPLHATVSATAGAGPGTITSPVGPRQAAMVCTLLTDFAGPAYRGRLFWPFPPASDDTDIGVPSTAYRLLVSAVTNQAFALPPCTGSGGTFQPVWGVYHRNPAVLPKTTPITGIILQTKWGTQKRRGSYGRQNKSPI